ncbi:MAG TPA: hypothetical protein VGJ48_26450, partial [Pyrinomonadaceae bacterium]
MKVQNAMKFPVSIHKLIPGLLVLILIGLFIPQTAFAQKEKLGIVNYTPPNGWNKTPKENVVAFSTLNATTG